MWSCWGIFRGCYPNNSTLNERHRCGVGGTGAGRVRGGNIHRPLLPLVCPQEGGYAGVVESVEGDIWSVNLEPTATADVGKASTSRESADACEPIGHPFLVTRDGAGPFTYDQTRSAKFLAPARGLRMQTDRQKDLWSRCGALQLLLPPEAAFVGSTAALIHGIPLPPWMTPSNLIDSRTLDADDVAHPQRVLGRELRIEVAYPPPVLRRRMLEMRHRQWKRDPIGLTTVGDLRVLSPARTWIDLAGMIPADYLLAAGDHILRANLAHPEELALRVGWAKRRRGVRTAKSVIEMLNPLAESPPESRVRYWLATGGLPAPEVNGDIVIDGEWFARGDLVFRDAKVVVEYEGSVHVTTRMHDYDSHRRALLHARGWLVVVLTARSLRNPHMMVDTVRAHLDRASHR